jgi:hypothetical protein
MTSMRPVSHICIIMCMYSTDVSSAVISSNTGQEMLWTQHRCVYVTSLSANCKSVLVLIADQGQCCMFCVGVILNDYACFRCEDDASHRDFRERCGAAFVKFHADSSSIVVLVC